MARSPRLRWERLKGWSSLTRGPFWGRPIDYFRMRDAGRTASGYEDRLEPLVAGVSESVLVIDDRLERIARLTSAEEEISVTYDFAAGSMPPPSRVACRMMR